MDDTDVEIPKHSHTWRWDFTKITGWDFNCPSPVPSFQLLQSHATPHQDSGNPLKWISHWWRTCCNVTTWISCWSKFKLRDTRLVTVYHDAERTHHVLERVKKDREHQCWETLFRWSQTPTGTLKPMLHLTLILLLSATVGLLLKVLLYIRTWWWAGQVTLLQNPPHVFNVA